MAHTILELENPSLENHKRYIDAPVGFSWTGLFFTGLTMLYRRQVLLSVTWSILAQFIFQGFGFFVGESLGINAFLGGVLLIFPIRLIIAALYNSFCIYRLKNKGYKLTGARPAKGSISMELPLEALSKKHSIEIL